MSLSIPTTSKPLAAKKVTASEPISPPAPVINATDMSGIQNRLERFTLGAQPRKYVIEQLCDAAPRRPAGRRGDVPVVRDVVRNVGAVGLGPATNRQVATRPFATE